jgi:diguanylate cyclase (GGDEF)-like protein
MKEAEALKRLKAEVEFLKDELGRRTKELSFFIDSGKALTSALEFERVLGIIMERAQQLIKCQGWSLLLVGDDDDELRFAATKGKRNLARLKKVRVKMGQGVAGWVAQSGQPVIVPDVQKDRRFYKGVDQISKVKTHAVLCVPIINKRRVVGVLEMINKHRGQPFDDYDMQLLSQLVDQAAIALERAQLYQQMTDLATTDDLTKLFNFRHFDKSLDHEINRVERYGSELSLIFFDMDYFKQVNDNHGHLMGSRVLVEVAHILVKSLRNVDIISRYGGDEFVIMLPETSVKTALRITQRLQRSIMEHRFLSDDELSLQLTASFGISGFPEHAKSKKDLIRLADQAMYHAKNTGRNRICVAESTLTGEPDKFYSLLSERASGSWPAPKSRSPKRSRRRSASS